MPTSNADVRAIVAPLSVAAEEESRQLFLCLKGLHALDETGDMELSTAARAARVTAIKAVVAAIPSEWVGAPE